MTADGFNPADEYGTEAVMMAEAEGTSPPPTPKAAPEVEGFNPEDEQGAESDYWKAVKASETPVLTAIDPAGCPLGPPEDVLLTVTGTGFDESSQIAFGRNPDGTPKFERETVFVDETTLTIYVTAGLFPNPDPTVPVLVGNMPPHGPTSNEVAFAIG